MKKLFSLLLFLFVILIPLMAQEGAVPLSHFQESREIENQSWAICQDGDGVMLFANRRGIMTFDGQDWNFIRMPAVPYSISYSSVNNRVYAGCDNNYGYLEKDEKGFYSYTSLSADSAEVGLISRISCADSTIWFYSETAISRHKLESGLLEKRFRSNNAGTFTGMFLTPKNTFINVAAKGLFRVEADTLFPIVTGYLLKEEEVLFCLPYDNKMVLLGLGNGSLKLFDGIKFHDYGIKDDGYLSDNILTDGVVVTDSLYAFSTVNGGGVVVEKKTGKLTATINYRNGLPDDEIYAIAADNKDGLWLSHQYGLSRAALRLPAGNFSIYPGLQGNLTGTLWHNRELYVATSEGVFYLDEVRNYGEVEVLVKNEKASSGPSSGPAAPVQQTQETTKTKKRLLSRIFGKKESSDTKTSAAATTPQVSAKAAEPQFVKRKESRLKSINYIYRKVDGLNDKCKQLVSASGEILVSTNSGLYTISDHRAKPVVRDIYVNHISQKLFGNRYYIATADGYFYLTNSSGTWKAVYPDSKFNQPLYSITSGGKDILWAGGSSTAYRITLAASDGKPAYKDYSVKNDFPNKYLLENANDTIFLFTEGGIYYYNNTGDIFETYSRGNSHSSSRMSYIVSQPGVPWFNTGDEWVYLRSDAKVKPDEAALLKLFDDVISVTLSDNFLWVVSGSNQLYRIAMNKNLSVKTDLNLFVKSATNEDGNYFELSDIVFRRGDNTVYFDLVSPGYYKQNSTQYQYLLEGYMTDWSKWTSSSTITLMPPPGEHTIKVRAKDIWGNVSEPKSFRFKIKAPLTRTTGFYVLILAVVALIIILTARVREARLKKEKLILEEKVQERTKEIQAQKEEITSSIAYASRIQMAMLPTEDLFRNSFSEHFILYRPRDIVSGDFYWIGEDDNHVYFTVADCTGHGVPGAFMSTLGISTLNEIIANGNDYKANMVLNLLRNKVKTSLHQTGKEGEAADGMDIALCILHKKKKILEFAGAYNPVFVFHDNTLNEYKGDRMPIGIHYVEKDTFTNNEIKVTKGDAIYLFSDGFCDQFGGPEGVKYKIANLKKLLTEINMEPMAKQKP
ncbi:MAG: SpoIIE family protein phosphatase [Bacteroidetes bacterium]|nr:SpoIIE family protein phosphatase [Bacteroidota bacterium]